jgi:RNA polymerase sigma factor
MTRQLAHLHHSPNVPIAGIPERLLMLQSSLGPLVSDIPEPNRDEFTRIQNGDRQLREEMLLRYEKFIKKYICFHHASTNQDDAYSTALSALNEALSSYKPEMERSFKSHAIAVIKCRLIDEERRNNRTRKTFPFSWFQKPEEEKNRFEQTWLIAEIPDPDVKMEFRMELDVLHDTMKAFHITMEDMCHAAPRHIDSRRLAIRIGITLAGDGSLFGHLIKKHVLPVNQLARIACVNNKTIHRHKNYVILIALIWNSRLDIFRDYIRDLLKEGDAHD